MIVIAIFILIIIMIISVLLISKSKLEERPCSELIPDTKEDRTSVKMPNIRTIHCLQFKIVGTNYRDKMSKYTGKYKGTVVPEPENESDANAIKVLASDGHHVGYIPAQETQQLREWVNYQFPYPCKIDICKRRDKDTNKFFYFGNVEIIHPDDLEK